MQPFRERFGETVRERFEEDVRIVVVRALEALEVRLDAVDRDGEAADPVAGRVDEVGKAEIGPIAAFGDLLAEKRETRAVVEHDIVALAPARPQAAYALGNEPV